MYRPVTTLDGLINEMQCLVFHELGDGTGAQLKGLHRRHAAAGPLQKARCLLVRPFPRPIAPTSIDP